MSDKKKKNIPLPEEPDDTVDTIYCDEGSTFYNNIITGEDAFPYQSPLPKYRRTPEPPII